MNEEQGAGFTIYTVASDGRITDLAVLLESNFQHDRVEVRVAPFDENLEITRKLCRCYGAKLIKPEDRWDRLGKTLFGDRNYRPGVKRWRYFRKLNALSDCAGPFIFFDANVAIVHSLRDLTVYEGSQEFIFGRRSAKYRNFPSWAVFLLSYLAPDKKYGFNAGFWSSRPGVLDLRIFEEIAEHPDIQKFLTMSPEQSVLSLVLALQGVRVKLIPESVAGAEGIVGAKTSRAELVETADNRVTVKGRTVYALKWPGTHHVQEGQVPLYDFYSRFACRAIERIDKIDSKLAVVLRDKYAELGIGL